MEPLFRSLVVGLAPQPKQIPPAPFDKEELQRVFVEVNRITSYTQFSFLPGDSGAQLLNSAEDRVLITPGLIQLFALVSLTAERTRETAVQVLEAICTRLKVDTFLQCGLKVIAHVPAPGERPDARAFISEHFLRGAPSEKDLGPDFFAGGVKYRSFTQTEDQNLLIEPLAADNQFVYIDYDVQRVQPVGGLDAVSEWIGDAFGFVSGPTMGILEA